MIFAPASSLAERAARLICLAVLIGIGISHVVFAIRDWPLHDMDVYLAAASRLRDGDALYAGGDVAVNSYWYAPWYAALWIPLTLLPRETVAVIWSAALLAATALIVVLLTRQGSWARVLALLVGPPLFAVSAGGNVQALMILGLMLGLPRRWGPVAIGVAASMKFTPILLALAYAARREWWKAAMSVVVTAALLVPSYLMGIMQANVTSAAAPSLLGTSTAIYVAAVVSAVGAVFLVARRHAFLAAAVAAVLALPRLFVYDVTLLAVAAADSRRPHPPDST